MPNVPGNKLRPLFRVLTTAAVCMLAFAGCSEGEPAGGAASSPRFRITTPGAVLRDIPVNSVTIEATTPVGEGDDVSYAFDPTFSGEAEITGLRIVQNDQESTGPRRVKFEFGLIEFRTNFGNGTQVFVDGEIAVTADGETSSHEVRTISGFWSLVPPLVAIVLAIVLKDVYVALLAAVFSGVLVLTGGNPLTAFSEAIGTHVLGRAADSWNMQVIVFTLFLGAMIQVMSASGGTQAVVSRLSGFTSTRERGQLLTWFMGLLVFFDDYANTMLVGGAMRPVTDRLRISREKLAFLIDSTAAPIAGLAIVSTWVGVEVGYIGDGFESLELDKKLSYAVFLKTIPFRFYPLFLIGFVMLIAASGRDFGPMLKSERRALTTNPPVPTTQKEQASAAGSMWYAIVPVLVLVGWIAAGFAASLEGDGNILSRSWSAVKALFSGDRISFGEDFDSVPLLLQASFASALIACLLPVFGRTLKLRESAQAWVKGMTEMFPAIVVLILAWTVSAICKPENLNTAGFIIDAIGDDVSPELMPTLAFVISGAVAFAIGSSYTTMGLLIPLFMSLVGFMLATQGGVTPDHPLMLSSIGAILAGSIFGDHCSPISDTTVLSSAGAQCNHLRHVATQMPYALTVGGIAIVFGYLPAGYGMNPWLMLPLGLVACAAVIFLVGRRAEALGGDTA